MEAFNLRLQDTELETNFNPIVGLEDTPVLSLRDAIRKAQEDSEFGDYKANFDNHVKVAFIFAEDVVDRPGELLSVDEIAAIQIYTQESPLYRILNARLRDRDRGKLSPFLPFAKLLLTAIYKLPAVPKTVFRGVKLDLKSVFTPNKKKLWWAFSSCTAKMEVLQSELFVGTKGQRTIFTIVAETAYDISKYSAIGKEHEFILPPGSELSVVSAFTPSDDLHLIQLRQLPYDFLFKQLGMPKEQFSAPRSNVSAAASPS